MKGTILRLPSDLSRVCCDVRDLAPLLPPAAEELRWCLTDAYEIAEPILNVDAWEAGVGRFPFEAMNFGEMSLWWSRLLQTFWGTYVAAETDAALDRFPSNYLFRIEPEVLADYPFAIQACDVSYWLIHSTDVGFLQSVVQTFPQAVAMTYEPGHPSREP